MWERREKLENLAISREIKREKIRNRELIKAVTLFFTLLLFFSFRFVDLLPPPPPPPPEGETRRDETSELMIYH